MKMGNNIVHLAFSPMISCDMWVKLPEDFRVERPNILVIHTIILKIINYRTTKP